MIPKSLTTVTVFSKLLALFLFILFPFIGFYFGIGYQKSITPQFDFENWQKQQSLKQKNNLKPTPTQEKTITLIGTVREIPLKEPHEPEAYHYEILLDNYFFDPLQSTGYAYIDTIPLPPAVYMSGKAIFSNGDYQTYLNKRIVARGTIEWGQGESRYFNISQIIAVPIIKNWNIYSDPEYHFTFQYPSDLNFRKENNLFEINNKVNEEFKDQFAFSFSGYINRYFNEKSAPSGSDNIVEKKLNLENFKKLIKENYITLFTGNPPDGFYSIYIPLKNQEGKYLEISVMVHHATEEEDIKIINKILSTFLFLQ